MNRTIKRGKFKHTYNPQKNDKGIGKYFINIQNIVASMAIDSKLDLDRLHQEVLPEAYYHPKIFPGLIFRPENFPVTILFFRSGKINCTGAKSEEIVYQSLTAMHELLIKNGLVKPETTHKIRIANMVSSAFLNHYIRLGDVAKADYQTSEILSIDYEPEQFPGLVLKLADPSVVILLFLSGKIVCTGATNFNMIQQAIERADRLVQQYYFD